MNKKGSARDVIMIIAVLFALSIGFFVMNFMSKEVSVRVNNTQAFNDTPVAQEAINSIDQTADRLDYVYFGVFIGFVLALIITGWFVGGQMIFAFIYFIMIIIGVALSFIFSNVWEDISGMALFGGTVSSFPITNHIMLNLPTYAIAIGFIGLVVMFAKPYFEARL